MCGRATSPSRTAATRSPSVRAVIDRVAKPPYPPWKNSSGVTGRFTSIAVTAHSSM